MRYLIVTSCLLSLSACSYYSERFSQLGKTPEFAVVDYPQNNPRYQEIKWPDKVGPPNKTIPRSANSLWQEGSRTFFQDQRARRIGDIVKVVIKMTDKASLNNQTTQQRNSADNSGATSALGLEKKVSRFFGVPDPSKLIDLSGKMNTSGQGQVQRKEEIQTQVAATVIQILPNGNLVISGKQEMMVNYDLREVGIQGIIRPEDIGADNTISSDQVAEARIIYGGRGQLMNVQQPRVGTQIIDIISPF